MSREEQIIKIHNYCMEKPCAYESRPFGEQPVCYRVGGRIFAQFVTKPDWYKMTLKTNPEAALFYREMFPGKVVRGYHCPPVQQPYWNTIELTDFPEDMLLQMIDEAYTQAVKGLTRKQQNKLPGISGYQFVKTDGEHPDFAILCGKLDRNLDEIVGKKFKREQYAKYNLRDSIHDVILVMKNGTAVACGGYKFYDQETAEIKRVFVDSECRGQGIGRELILRLEADARMNGYRTMLLETGEPLEAAMKLYQKAGYKVIPNYGQYAEMKDSVCMSKRI